MSLVLKLFWAVMALELLIWILPKLGQRRFWAPTVIILLMIVSAAMFVLHPSVPTGLLLVTSAYRICNLIRLVRARINEEHLRRVTVRASIWIIVIQMVILMLWGLGALIHISTYHWWIVLTYADLAIALMLLVSTLRHVHTTRAPVLTRADIKLPTLTVAIPARNETDDLERCLRSLVTSDYPKLEILVIDDCSQDRRTPEIIRSFAHDGVRFVHGQPPEPNWLAKNKAYQRLFEEANGELLLFCGVDIDFTASSLRQLVTAMLQKHKSMISVIPKNTRPKSFAWDSFSLIQPVRYAWELALPRRLLRRPPVLSTCWIIKRDLLENAGGFAAVSRSIVPESYFARASAVHDGYSFMQSDESIGISSHKSFADQLSTAVRTRYPQLHRRIELVLVLTLGESIGVMMPLVLLVVAAIGRLSLQLTIVSFFTATCLVLIFVRITALTYRQWILSSLILLPFAIVLDALLLNYSMLRYEFFGVIWKGRDVCIPVMRVVEHLPVQQS